MKKNLVLLGMMAVGKTTLGKIVAKKQELEFIDTDANIVKKIVNCDNLLKCNKLIITDFLFNKFIRCWHFYFIKQKYS